MAPNAADGRQLPLDRVLLSRWSGINSSIWPHPPTAEAIRTGCCGKVDMASPWMEWVESGIEFFGCDESSPRKSVFGRTLLLRHVAAAGQEADTPKKDFAKTHDEFIAALLHEQILRASTHDLSSPEALVKRQSMESSSSISTVSSSFTLTLDDSSASSTKAVRPRRPFKLSKGASGPHTRHARIAPIEAYSKLHEQSMNDSMSFSEILEDKQYPEPMEIVHQDCRLQKDKGKGEPIGSAISAEGRDRCLEKLREKMELLMQVATGEGRKANATMKRRSAKVCEVTSTYTETRSLIELRLGFLSMQYGLLLRWDTHRTGKVILIVLRKMCHDSFYTKFKHSHVKTNPIDRPSGRAEQQEPPPLVIRNIMGNHAIYQRRLGTEVVFIYPPYRVAQPEIFAPSTLSVRIHEASGLSKRSRWTVSLTFEGHTEATQLHWSVEKQRFEAKRSASMEWQIAPVTSFDLAGLEIRLFESRKRRNSHSRLASTMTMPVGGLVAQPSTTQATSWKLTLPFLHDHNASITLSLIHQSDYSLWLHKELDARRREEVSGFVWKAPFKRTIKRSEDDTEDEFLWDWICGICLD